MNPDKKTSSMIRKNNPEAFKIKAFSNFQNTI